MTRCTPVTVSEEIFFTRSSILITNSATFQARSSRVAFHTDIITFEANLHGVQVSEILGEKLLTRRKLSRQDDPWFIVVSLFPQLLSHSRPDESVYSSAHVGKWSSEKFITPVLRGRWLQVVL